MLDALVAEARLRWGLDLAAGLQVLAAERLDRYAARAVPAGSARAAGDAPADARTTASRRSSRCPAGTGPAGDDPLAVLGRLYPADHPVGRFGAADG